MTHLPGFSSPEAKKDGLLVVFVQLFFAVIVSIPLALYRGWILWLLLGWFTYPFLPAISWKASVGVMFLLTGIIVMSVPYKDTRSVSELFKDLIPTQVALLVCVGIGYFLHILGFGFNPSEVVTF